MEDESVSIVLPCYNERDSITQIISRLTASMPFLHEVIVVDDDSPDGTGRAVKERFERHSNVKVVRRFGERGLTSAIQRGIDESTGSIVAWMDCDLSMPPESMRDLVMAVIDGSCETAVGSRYVRGGSDVRYRAGSRFLKVHVTFSLLLSRFTTACLQQNFHDWTSGFIAVRRDVLCNYPLRGDYGEYFIRLMHSLLSNGHNVKELPYTLYPRTFGESKTASTAFGLAKRGLKYLAAVVECMARKPASPKGRIEKSSDLPIPRGLTDRHGLSYRQNSSCKNNPLGKGHAGTIGLLER